MSFSIGKKAKNPLDRVKYSGDLEKDAMAEFDAIDQGYRDRAKQEADRFRRVTDSEYWFAVCFKSREEKNEFLKKVGVKTALMGDKYLDGHMLAKILGIKLGE